MGIFDFLFSRPGKGFTCEELYQRLGVSEEDLQSIPLNYTEFTIPKRSGGTRKISAPCAELKTIQRRILHKILAKLKPFPAAMGFEKGKSIVHAVMPHTGKAVLIRMDIKNFFSQTRKKRVHDYFRRIGWNKKAASLLTSLCTYDDGLPQGAPTSPRLSNLMNFAMDARLAGLAISVNADYSRYADDMIFSYNKEDRDTKQKIIGSCKKILSDFDYTPHQKKKLRILRKHQQQKVLGLILNETIALPRETRKWLRAVRHRLKTSGECTLASDQLKGWDAFELMIEKVFADGQ